MSDSSDELTGVGQAENPRDRLSEVEEQLEHVQRGAVLRSEIFCRAEVCSSKLYCNEVFFKEYFKSI